MLVTSPKRIQRKRTKGWKMPNGAIYVGRPTKWGNPFAIGTIVDRIAFTTPRGNTTIHTVQVKAPVQAVECYRRWLCGTPLMLGNRLAEHPPTVAQIRAELAGRDLACWCPLIDSHGDYMPCHADVLLELANPGWNP